jgi:2-polyprenyl-3-methyl-5-hydroxy-6-metoxy-1,4-benzoquinol methylase
MKSNLTDKFFWNDYWSQSLFCNKENFLQQEKDIIYNFRNIFQKYRQKNNINKKNFLKVLEIGGAGNGKILKSIYFSGKYKITSVDYSKNGNKLLTSNFKINNIKSYKIINANIFSYKTQQKYDFVYSLGFIEHFTKIEYVIKTHLRFLKNKGFLIIGFPNFSNLNGFLLKFLNNDLYNKHNIKIMCNSFFNQLAKKIKCNLIFYKNISGYEPNMISVKKDKNTSLIIFFLFYFFFRTLNFLNKIYFLKFFKFSFLNSYVLVVLSKK